MTKKDLQAKCKEQGLSPTGTKSELEERLAEPVVEAEPTPVVRKDAGYYSSRRKDRGWH